MLAVSGTRYRMYANVVHSLVTDRCQASENTLDTQFGFYPGRNTLQPIFILRHLQHAARTLKPGKSGCMHTPFINFKQVYDTIPKQDLWQHLLVGAHAWLLLLCPLLKTCMTTLMNIV
jgi:hypothetical protein